MFKNKMSTRKSSVYNNYYFGILINNSRNTRVTAE